MRRHHMAELLTWQLHARRASAQLFAQRASCAHGQAPALTRSYSAASEQEETRDDRRQRRRAALRLAAWVPVAAFVFSHVVSIGQVKGGSMIPTFNPEAAQRGTKHGADVVLLNRWVIGNHMYRVGDVVHLISPTDPDLLLTKRILALEGDIVVLHTPIHAQGAGLLPKSVDLRTRIRVPPGHAWVEGDASAEEDAHLGEGKGKGRSVGHSEDSREFGPVPLGLITSRVEWILWPPSRFGRPAPRPGFNVGHGEFVSFDASGRVRRHHDHALRRPTQHPDDSLLTPYIDSDSYTLPKGGRVFTSGGGANAVAMAKYKDADLLQEARRRELAEDGIDEAAERRRALLNLMSRGGALGDATDDEEVQR